MWMIDTPLSYAMLRNAKKCTEWFSDRDHPSFNIWRHVSGIQILRFFKYIKWTQFLNYWGIFVLPTNDEECPKQTSVFQTRTSPFSTVNDLADNFSKKVDTCLIQNSNKYSFTFIEMNIVRIIVVKDNFT